MRIGKYFWWMNAEAVKETEKIIRNPAHPLFVNRIYEFLSRNDDAKALFRLISRKDFVEQWPKVRLYWNKKSTAPDFKAWWETLYEQILKSEHEKTRMEGGPSKTFEAIARAIRDARIEKGWSQSDFARRVRMNQPNVSKMEKGRMNMTLQTLVRICKVLEIKNIAF